MTTHHVKSWAHFFDEIKAGNKLHDLRKLDRDYKVGDKLILQRYDYIVGEYTGEELEVEISYITSNKVPCAFSSSALDKGYGIFSLKLPDTRFVIYADQFVVSESEDNRINLDRSMPIVTKDIKMNDGGVVRKPKAYLMGEQTQETYVSPTSPNPNAEYYQNR